MKRLLSCLLCAALLLSLLAATASAADLGFSDAGQLTYPAECAVLVDLGILSGMPDGSFAPASLLTCAEAASLLARFSGGTVPASGPVAGLSPDHWAASAVNACLQRGILTQADAKDFNPDRAVTLEEFARMLLRMIGHRNISDANFSNLCEQAGLFDGYTGSLDRFLTRDLACLICYNALGNLAIAGWEGENPIYYTDDLLNPMTILEYRFGVTRYTEVVVANEYASLEEDGEPLEPGYTKLAEHRAFAVSTDLSVLGRTAEIFLKDGEVIGVPRLSVTENYATLSSNEQYRYLVQNTDFCADEHTRYYLNYTLADADCLNDSYDRCEITVVDYDCDGVFDLILVSAWQAVTVFDVDPFFVTFPDGVSRLLQGYENPNGLMPGDDCFVRRIAGVWYVD